MRLPTQLNSPSRRSGAVLLIVITLMALFTAVGLSFVYYAEAEASASKLFRESTDLSRPDVDPELALAYFLGKLIYGEADDETGIYSAIRGHELARSMYGGDHTVNASGVVTLGNRRAPYTGAGRLHYTYPAAAGVLANVDDYGLINYTGFRDAKGNLVDGFLRDPERLNFRTSIAAGVGQYAGGFNVPWTYPDLHSLFLSAIRIDPTTGNPVVLTPSFHREYLFGRLDQTPAQNPNWTNAIGKYLTLRPRPADHLGFPYPEGRGDVQNLPGTNGPDSIWIDSGAPVLVAADGRKYKMMFAPLIIDLDGRLNLNVHGNLAGVSNQGWTRGEVNLTKALSLPASLFSGGTNPTVAGRFGPTGPSKGTIGMGPTPIPVPSGPWYAPTDLNGDGTMPQAPASGSFNPFPTFPGTYGNGSAAELTGNAGNFNFWLSGGNDGPSLTGDRVFTAAHLEAMLRYGDKGSPALTSDFFRLMPASFSQNARLRHLVTPRSFDLAMPGLTPWVVNPADPTTTYTYNPALGYPTGAPMTFPPTTSLATAGTPPPAGSDFAADNPNNPTMTWARSISTAVSRIDLNRNLAQYPAADPTTGLIDMTNAANVTAFTTAVSQRQALAKSLYSALLKATGTRDPNTTATLTDPNPEYQAARWLAQLAVNIVDYVDPDDYMTPFLWYQSGATSETLFGTEVPRLVINEAYVQYDNDNNDPSIANQADMTKRQASSYKLNVWVEFHNPFKSTAATANYPGDGSNAYMQRTDAKGNTTQVVYQVLVTRPNINLTVPSNLLGIPDPQPVGGPPQILTTMNVWGPNANQQVVAPAGTSYGDATKTNQGFYILGPKADFLTAPANPNNRDPNLPVTYASPLMSISPPGSPPLTDAAPVSPTVMLQRLACPHMPFDNNQTTLDSNKNTVPNPTYNPYITVDYMENIPANDNRDYVTTVMGPLPGPNNVPPVNPLPSARNSVGRRQPYAGDLSQLMAQSPLPLNPPPNPAPLPQPAHTFFRHNGRDNTPPLTAAFPMGQPAQTLQDPFDWLVHLDRPLISPMELLQVSAVRPHLLTHQFVTTTTTTTPGPPPVTTTTTNKFQHRAKWFGDNLTATPPTSTRLYRFLELVRTRDLMAGMSSQGRVPGMINLNAVWEPEVLQALQDHPQAAAIFTQMINQRSPGFVIGPTDHHMTAAQATAAGFTLNTPFRPLSTGLTAATVPGPTGGQYPVPTGVNNTILRPFTLGATGQRLFDVTTDTAGNAVTHPYLKHSVLTKMFNNVTTRSNVFAVWVTVGFFQVMDETTRPVKLGPEIGRSENRHVRHRFFAVVDRSDLRVLNLTSGNAVDASKGPTQLTLTSTTGSITFPAVSGAQMTVQLGDIFTIDPNTAQEETVTVSAVTPTSFTATCRKSHAAGATVTFRGHPGPWPNYNPRLDRTVVPYFSVID